MSNDYDELLGSCRALFQGPDHAILTDDAVLRLRQMAIDDIQAREALVELIVASDSRIRILAAEALSRVGYAPEDAIPVLMAVLDVFRELDCDEENEPWARIALGALTNYGTDAGIASETVWPLLYVPAPQNTRLYAARFAVRNARHSEASWTIACLLCNHVDDSVSQLAREEMSALAAR